jgi:hypothetical protein
MNALRAIAKITTDDDPGCLAQRCIAATTGIASARQGNIGDEVSAPITPVDDIAQMISMAVCTGDQWRPGRDRGIGDDHHATG